MGDRSRPSPRAERKRDEFQIRVNCKAKGERNNHLHEYWNPGMIVCVVSLGLHMTCMACDD